MKKLIGLGMSLVLFGATAGIALAKDGGSDSSQTGAGISQNLQVGVNLGVRDDSDEDEDISASADVEERGNATSTSRDKGQRGEEERDEHASSTDNEQDDDNGQGKEGRSGLVSFLRWIFGLPATTTVGDIRAEIGATTTASTTSNNDQGLGLFVRSFFSAIFHLFGRGDN